MGARVIKTGSRAYASRTGSVDLLDRLGIQQTTSYEQTEEMLDTHGIACAGPFVYPKELRLLARAILPFGMKTVGRFFNVIGPFLAANPVSTQITGVSDHSVLPTFRGSSPRIGASASGSARTTSAWTSCSASRRVRSTTASATRSSRSIRASSASAPDRSTTCFPLTTSTTRSATSSRSSAAMVLSAALESIRLNAAALAMNGGVVEDLPAGLELAAEVMAGGEPARLIERMRAPAASGAPAA